MNKLLKMLPVVLLSLGLVGCGLIADPSSEGNSSSSQEFDEDALWQITGLMFSSSPKESQETLAKKDYALYYTYIDGVDYPKDYDASCFKLASMKINIKDESRTDEFATTVFIDYGKVSADYDLYCVNGSKKGGLENRDIYYFDSSFDNVPASSVFYQIQNTYPTGKVMTYRLTVNLQSIDELTSLDVLEFKDDDTLNKKTVLTSDNLVTDFVLQASTAYTLVKSYYRTATSTYTTIETIMTASATSSHLYQPMFTSDLGIVDCSPISFHYENPTA